jgi:heptosyltransferase-2
LPSPGLRVAVDEIERVEKKFGLTGPYVALCPGAEYGPAKRWPYFADLAARLGMPAVVLGSASDAPAAQGVGGTNLVGRTSLDEAIALIAGAHAVVSNDSGLMHVAAALGRPQVALFGSSSPEHTPPASAAARVIWLHVECSPCYRRECPLGHFRCMKEIDVGMVLERLKAFS